MAHELTTRSNGVVEMAYQVGTEKAAKKAKKKVQP